MFITPERNIVFRILGFFLRVRAELTITVVVILIYSHTEPLIGADWTLTAMGSTAALVFLVPPSRRFVMARVWCVITRHRIRSCLNRCKVPTMTRNGRMPFLLWAHPSPVGENVRVWIPAGLAATDIDRITPQLATACWAAEVRIRLSRSQSATCVIEVIRRDPLASARPVTPVLVSDIADAAAAATGNDAIVVPLPRREDLHRRAPDQPAAASGTDSTSSSAPISAPSSTPRMSKKNDPTPPASGLGGIDVSDYI